MRHSNLLNHLRLRLPILLILVGVMAIVFAVAADFLGFGGQPGFGRQQMRLASYGIAAIGIGIVQQLIQGRIKTSIAKQAVQPTGVIILVVWFGMLTGLGEVMVLVVRKFIFHGISEVGAISFGPHMVWMAPLANVLCIAIPGAIAVVATLSGLKLFSLRVVVSLLSFFSFLSLLMMYPRLHFYAAMLLAVGLSIQTARFIAAHSDRFHLLVRRTLSWMITLVVGLTLGMYGWQWISERRALAKLPPAEPTSPNVLLIVLDTVRSENLSLYGYNRPTTPQLEKLAQSAVLFEKAISTAPWTLPSHASMFTGRFHYETSTGWKQPLDDTFPTLAEILNQHGYLTAGFVANTVYCNDEFGLSRGFNHYEDYFSSLGQIIRCSTLGAHIVASETTRQNYGYNRIVNWKKTAPQVNDAFLRWLARKGDRPFFGFLNYYDAHDPYVPPKPFDRKFITDRPKSPWLRPWQHYSSEEIQLLMGAYDGGVAYLDYHLGLLFDEMEKRDLLTNTLVIITSDHGEHFGEHGIIEHGNSLYMPLLHVPLLIRFPSSVPEGRAVSEPVSLRDLPATIVDLIGLSDKARFPGHSLARYWKSSATDSSRDGTLILAEVNAGGGHPTWFPIAKGDMKSLVSDRYHYIRNGDGSEELYDLRKDPGTEQNLVGSDGFEQVISGFRETLRGIHPTIDD